MSRDWVDPTPRWPTLQAAIGGDVALPGSIAYDRVDRPFNARFHHVRPQAIVRGTTPEDVSETVSFLAGHGLASAMRGGHCFAGYSSTGGVVIDVTPMGAARRIPQASWSSVSSIQPSAATAAGKPRVVIARTAA